MKRLYLGLALSIGLAFDFQANATTVSGNIFGTWTPAGNPYIVVDNCTVQSGTSLTIEPGVIVELGLLC
jgi:hypothetical protein